MNEQVTISVAPGGAPSTAGGAVVVQAASTLTGWEDVEITLRCEGYPPTFNLRASSGMPRGRDAAIAKAGDACFVRAGDDLLVTGYVTSLTAGADAGSHEVQIAGAGKTQDLADCEIEWDQSRTYLSASLPAIEDVADQLGLSVTAHGGIPDLPFDYPIQLDYGVPAGDYIGSISRALGVLVYEGNDGSLVVAPAGDMRAASGAAYGQNIQSFSVVDSMEGRFSEVRATYFRQNQFLDGTVAEPNFFFTAIDPGVLRHRVKHVFVGDGPNGNEFAERVARWEVARRAARGRIVRVTVDSWRDKAGTLWTPNTMIPIDLPGLPAGGTDLCLSEVTFRQNDATGTTAELVLMPREGFTPEPVQVTPAILVGVKPSGQS